MKKEGRATNRTTKTMNDNFNVRIATPMHISQYLLSSWKDRIKLGIVLFHTLILDDSHVINAKQTNFTRQHCDQNN
jgi:hypothetical protein